MHPTFGRRLLTVLAATFALFVGLAANASSASALPPGDPWGYTGPDGQPGQRFYEDYYRGQDNGLSQAGAYYRTPQGQAELKDAVCDVVETVGMAVDSVSIGTVVHVTGPQDKSLKDMIARKVRERLSAMKNNPLGASAGVSLTIVSTACDIREQVERTRIHEGGPGGGVGPMIYGGTPWVGGSNSSASLRDTGSNGGAANGPGGMSMTCSKVGDRVVCVVKRK